MSTLESQSRSQPVDNQKSGYRIAIFRDTIKEIVGEHFFHKKFYLYEYESIQKEY